MLLRIRLKQTFCEFLFLLSSKRSCKLHKVDVPVSFLYSPNDYRHTFWHGKFHKIHIKAKFFQVRNIHILHIMNIFQIQIFAGIFVCIACQDFHSDCLAILTDLQNLTVLHEHVAVLYYTCVHWWYKLFDHWWLKGTYFGRFLFLHFFILTHKIPENKNLMKLSAFTVYKWVR